MSVVLGWYYHLPPCASEVEIQTSVLESLQLVLDAHEAVRAPVVLAPTGNFLSILEKESPGTLLRLIHLASEGTVEICGTTFFEIAPFLVPPRYLRAQIDLDILIKRRLFGRSPRVFWPGNFAWTPLLGRLLVELNLEVVLLDEGGLRTACQTQVWRWLGRDQGRMSNVLCDTGVDHDDVARGYLLRYSDESSLKTLFRSWAVQEKLSFGTQGCIHNAWDSSGTDQLAQEFIRSNQAEDNQVIFTGDDGDRINPVSIYQYRRLLDRISPHLGIPTSSLPVPAANVLDFLPTYAPGGTDFWNDDVTITYRTLLDEIYRLVDLGRISTSDVLPLQDVFPVFWKRISRSKWFYDRAWALLQRGDVELQQ
jgi:hypothetical protein